MVRRKKDPIWEALRKEAQADARREPMLASFLHATVLNHECLEDALSFLLSSKLGSPTIPAISLREVIDQAFRCDASIQTAFRADLQAVLDRDPACTNYSQPLLYFKGYQALQTYRVAHWLWNQRRRQLALYLQSRVSEVFDVDIHPAARIGKGILIDHAHGIVIGETAVIADNVSMLHNVTLGGTGKQTGDRHPKIRRGSLLAVGAKVLGNIEVGEGAKIGAGSVVLKSVPPHTTVVGVPGEVIGKTRHKIPAMEMDHQLSDDKNNDEADAKKKSRSK